MPGAAIEPLAPQASDFVEKTCECSRITGDAVVGIVALELAAQDHLLGRHRPVAMRWHQQPTSRNARVKRSLAVLRCTTQRPLRERPQK